MIVGVGLIILSLLIFAFKLFVSYATHGGAIGMVPVLDGAILPPILFTFGLRLCFLFQNIEPRGGFFAFFLVWLLTTILAYGAITFAGKLGTKRNH